MSFTDAGSYPTSLKPYVLLSGDFDRDGRVDLAVVNEEGSGVTVFLGRGDLGAVRRDVGGQRRVRRKC